VPRVQLLTKPNCHLCDSARAVVSEVCEQLNENFQELDITEHPNLAAIHADFVPVLLVDGNEIAVWQVLPEPLILALTKPKP
jgi:glutaredoxin